MALPKPNTVLQKLKIALQSDSIDPDVRELGTRLLQRLDAPVRVVILGSAGSGKSELVNFLAGQEIVPPDVSWPTLELGWGEELQTTLTHQSGDIETIAGRGIDQIAAASPTFVQVQAPLPFLENISLLDVGTGATAEAQFDAIAWAVKRADIALWCSQDFAKSERDAWSGVPDGLKDHSFFILTQADLLSSTGDLAARIAQLQDMVADEFHSFIPLATLQAIAATGSDRAVDQSVLAASGGEALITAINHQIATGRQSDTDNVQLFLRRHGLDTLQPAPIVAKQADAGAVTAAALGYLGESTATLSGYDPENPANILEFCVETADRLGEIFSDASPEDCAAIDLQDAIMQAGDVILLMKLEAGTAPAADAVTLLMQLRRDLQATIAA